MNSTTFERPQMHLCIMLCCHSISFILVVAALLLAVWFALWVINLIIRL